MLFTYPIAATAENWLHDTILEMLRAINDAVVAGSVAPAWPGLIPEQRRNKLKSRTSLRDRVGEYARAFVTLKEAERQSVVDAMRCQNLIAELLTGMGDCALLADLPESIRPVLRKLFDCAFDLLTPLGTRDAQYMAIYHHCNKLCPFCGCEFFDAPSAPREDLDHFLAKSIYPCAAANLRNLVPIGPKCNRNYKGDIDILRKNGVRRKAFDPYGTARMIFVSLDKSIPFGGDDGRAPRWQIEFTLSGEEVETWDDVFQVTTRYDRDVLTPNFHNWLNGFRAWCDSASLQPATAQDLLSCLERYISFLEREGYADRAFLKAAVFKMLHNKCEAGDERLTTFLLALANATP